MNLIYKHTSKTSEKSYIGKSMKGLTSRWNEHKRDALKGVDTHFYRAIRKYGEDDFVSTILEEDINEIELSIREEYWVEYYNTFNEGYNSTKGGDGTSGFKHSEETKSKMSLASMGIKKTKTHCDNIKKSKSNIPEDIKLIRNKKHSELLKGRTQTEESNIKRSTTMKGRKLSQEHIDNSAKARTGLKRTEEQNKRNSEAQMGRKVSDKTKNKISEASKGRNCLIIEIYNDSDKLIFICKENFRDFCKNKNLPYDTFYKSYNNNEKLYNTKQKLTFAKKKGYEIYLGWYAINKGKK